MATAAQETNVATLASYPRLILEAISALGEKEGSNKSSISKYMEATHKDILPEGHAGALSVALAKMKESGELLFLKNHYMKPVPRSPLRRGRGRPPKSKLPLPPGAAPKTPRPRGRPPKPKDLLAVAVAKAAEGFPRPRGRPLKKKKHRPAVVAVGKGVGPAPAVGGVKRGRGRPRKVRLPPTGLEVE